MTPDHGRHRFVWQEVCPNHPCARYAKKGSCVFERRIAKYDRGIGYCLAAGSEKHTARKFTAKSALVFTACRYVIYGLVYFSKD